MDYFFWCVLVPIFIYVTFIQKNSPKVVNQTPEIPDRSFINEFEEDDEFEEEEEEEED